MAQAMTNKQQSPERYGVIFHHKDNSTSKKLYTMKYNIAMVAIYAEMYDPDSTNLVTGCSVYEIDPTGNPVSLKKVVKRNWWM